MSMFELCNAGGAVVATGDTRKAVMAATGDLPAGTYTLFKNCGSFEVQEAAQVVTKRVRFESTTKRPRPPKTANSDSAPAQGPREAAEQPRRGLFGRG